MPASAVQYAEVDFVLDVGAIAPTVLDLASRNADASNGAGGPGTMELLDWVAIENRAFDEDLDIMELERIGSRIPLTCPECGGAIWEIRHGVPLRYRCHTGHAFTVNALATLQGQGLEEALWAAVRALHEQELLFQRQHQAAQARQQAGQHDDAAREYLLKAEQGREHGRLLCGLIGSRMHIAPG